MPDLKKITKAELAAELNDAQQERDQLREDRDQLREKANDAAKAAREKLDAEARAVDGCVHALDQLPRSSRTSLHDGRRSPAAVARVIRYLAARYQVDHILATPEEIESRQRFADINDAARGE